MITLNKFIDHTLLKADAKLEEIKKLCQEARLYEFKSVCVNPFYIPVCKKLLANSGVFVCTVIGFPLGQMNPDAKVFEAKNAISLGADEIDMVQNIAMAKDHNFEFIAREIKMIKNAIGSATLKVILENCLLTSEEIKLSCLAAKNAGADFVKTSTGFSKSGATIKDVIIMRETVGDNMGVKAAGGIHSKAQALDLIAAGANRIGSSKSVSIVLEK